jgi:predicted homoserine dehydrogenase-like protein
MRGPECAHVNDAIRHFDADELLAAGGIVDYVLGAQPGTGAFVIGHNDDPLKAEYMKYFKMGEGPLYVFYTPFHLPHLEVAMTIARAALFLDAAVAPLGAPSVDVVAYAKRDLRPGDLLDGIGGFSCYGVIENAADSLAAGHLPIGLSEGCRVLRPCPADLPVAIDAVERPKGRLIDRLRRDQDSRFSGARRARDTPGNARSRPIEPGRPTHGFREATR